MGPKTPPPSSRLKRRIGRRYQPTKIESRANLEVSELISSDLPYRILSVQELPETNEVRGGIECDVATFSVWPPAPWLWARQLLAAPAIGRAQAPWPDKPVRIIVPFAAGGGTNLVARPWADKLSQAFRQQFIIENRGGASGLIGAEAAAKSPPDGYTFLVAAATSVITVPLLRKVPYDHTSFQGVGRLGDILCGFVVHSRYGRPDRSAQGGLRHAAPGQPVT